MITALWIRMVCLAPLLAALAFLSACSTPPEEKPLEDPPIIVGKISKVFTEHQFVLVRYERHLPIPEKDTVLLSQNESGSRIANLVTSGERLPGGRDFAADIRKGYPAVGDLVFMYQSVADGSKGVAIIDPRDVPAVAEQPELPSEVAAITDTPGKETTAAISDPVPQPSREYQDPFPTKEELKKILDEDEEDFRR